MCEDLVGDLSSPSHIAATCLLYSAMKDGVTTGGEYAPPEFISTHPSHEHRIEKFDEWLPIATKAYEGDDLGEHCRRVRDDMATARRTANSQAVQREGRRT